MNTVKSTDGTAISYDMTGSGPPVVMVDAAGNFHGLRPMRGVIEPLARNFTVYTYDRRGRGDSGDNQPYDVDREIDDLSAMIRMAGGSAYVFGFSSGAVLALHAAAQGVPITRMGLLEPAFDPDDDPANEDPLGDEISALVAAGKRGDAFLHFNRSIGVPEAFVEGMPEMPVWPDLEKLAHTLVYDIDVTRSMTAEKLGAVSTPTLVVNSVASDDGLRTWAHRIAEVLPEGHHRELPGEWHGVDPDHLAEVLTAFYSTGR